MVKTKALSLLLPSNPFYIVAYQYDHVSSNPPQKAGEHKWKKSTVDGRKPRGKDIPWER